jgi:hypothetical protein
MTTPPARIFLRPIGSPLTIGMSGLAIASFVESGLDLKWVPQSQAVEVGLILVAVPFVLQLLATIFSYLARDGATGASTGLLATSWLALGLVHIVAGGAHTSGALGLMLVASGVILALSAVAVSSAKPLPGAVFAVAALRFVLAGVYELSGVGFWEHAAGIAGLVVSAGAAYCVLAFELEDQKRRAVLPTMRRHGTESAMSEGDAAVLDRVAREAGVRPTT